MTRIVLLIAAGTGISSFGPSAFADAWADLSSPDPAIQQAAFAQLSKGDADTRQKLKTELETLRKSAWFEAARAAQSAQVPFTFLRDDGNPPPKAEWQKLFQAWKEATIRLNRFIFDPPGKYQVPGGDASQWRPGVDVQPGQEEVEKLAREAIRAWNALNDFLARQARTEGWLTNLPASPRDASPITTQSVDVVPVYTIHDPTPWCLALVDTQPGREGVLVRAARQYRSAEEQHQRFGRQITALGPAVEGATTLKLLPVLNPFAKCLADLADAVSKNTPALKGWPGLGSDGPCPKPAQELSIEETQLVEMILRGLTAAQNPPGATGGQARHTWRTLQLYRLVCGARPLTWNEKLSQAAAAHARDMQRLNFFGHRSPVPGKTTLADRAVATGFYGPVGESLDRGTLGPQGENAVWRWRADAEHHRLLLSDAYSSGAIASQNDLSVLLVGLEGGSAASQPASSQP